MNETSNAAESNANSLSKTRPGGIKRWHIISLVIIAGLIYALQATSSLLDHALANLLSFSLVMIAWTIGLLVLRTYKKMYLGILATAIGLALFFTAYRFERFNAEMLPVFSSRLRVQPTLPPASNTAPQDVTFVARETDFPQFLGKNRNATIDQARLNTDWKANPPTVAWKQAIGEGWSGFAVQGDAAITLEQREEEEWVTAYSIIDGSMLWHHAVPGKHSDIAGGTGPRSTPTIFQNRVYATLAVSQFVCLDVTTGQEIWSQSLLQLADTTQEQFEQEVSWGRAGSPLIYDSSVILPFGGVGESAQPLIAFDAASGEELWRGGSGQISYSSPIIANVDGVEQLLLVSQDKVAGYDPQNGEQLWEAEWPGKASADPGVSHPIVVNGNELFLGKGYGVGSRLLRVTHEGDAWNTEVLWKSTSLKTKFTTAVVKDGYAYGLSDGILECVDINTGKRQWKKGRYRHGQTLLFDDHLLIASEGGDLVLVKLNPAEWDELFKIPNVISDVSWNTLAFSGNRLLMRNSDEVACVVLPVLPPVVDEEQDAATDEVSTRE